MSHFVFKPISCTLLAILQHAGLLLDERLKAMLDALTKAQKKQYETRDLEVLPPAGAAFLETQEDLALTCEGTTDSPVVVIRLSKRHSDSEFLHALKDAQIEFVEVPVSSQTGCVSYFVLRTSVTNSAGHEKAVALQCTKLLGLLEQAIAAGKEELLFVFVHDNDVNSRAFATLALTSSLTEKMRQSIVKAQAFVPPIAPSNLSRAKEKAEKYGEEPALFLPFETRPAGTGLKLELRLALLQTMYKRERRERRDHEPNGASKSA